VSDDALEPVRAFLVEDATAEARGLVAEARRDATARMSRARREAQRILAEAAEEGEEEAEQAIARELNRARREARSVVLGAQRRAYEELRRQASQRATELASEPRCRDVLDRLGESARRRLGAEAELVADGRSPGVVAVAGDRRVDLTVASLVDRALETLGPEIEELWA
jgi:vacuolar-type H+-ATPase subunit E/Vma4